MKGKKGKSGVDRRLVDRQLREHGARRRRLCIVALLACALAGSGTALICVPGRASGTRSGELSPTYTYLVARGRAVQTYQSAVTPANVQQKGTNCTTTVSHTTAQQNALNTGIPLWLAGTLGLAGLGSGSFLTYIVLTCPDSSRYQNDEEQDEEMV